MFLCLGHGDPLRQKPFGILRQGHALLLRQIQKNLQELIFCVIFKMKNIRDAAGQTGVGLEHPLHLFLVTRQDH